MNIRCTAVCDHPHREQRLELGDLLGHDTLGHRIVMRLARAEILTRQQLEATPWTDIEQLSNIGPQGRTRITNALKEQP